MVNKVILVGKLQYNAECKQTSNGHLATRLVVRTTESYKRDGETQYDNQYHNVKIFGDWVQSTGLLDRLNKDCEVYVEGKLSSYKYTNKQGNEVNAIEIICETIRII